ncbi:50S ribosomal protein L11 methyltransferase [uncultured Sphingomonas sp.]|uniref:50S ribosomal protein L11 methyltransferase n=1 Tax=uncultured Sphingomonas sp. TaxID=158754 RepID=UPI0035C9AD67
MSWRATLPCTRTEAELVGDAEPPEGAVLLVTEEDEAAGRWRLDAYLEGEPDPAMLARLAALVPSAASAPVVERLEDQDWVTLSQAGLEPIREGRFVVHTAAYPVETPPGGRAFLIEAAQAFGTGHHETTAGCLAMLDGLAGDGFADIVDLGTGTGLLAFAATHLWPTASVMATDIDPVAIAVTRENAERNGVRDVRLVVADGTRDPAIAAAAPYDLIVANILAGPLIAMAPDIAGIAAPGATIVLAGLLATQADAVIDAYRDAGCELAQGDRRSDWTILRLTAPVDPHGDRKTDGA